MRFSWLLLAAALLSGAALAQDAPSLALPVACRLGETCIVQNYVDHDPGPGARDYHCGFLSYDGHKGTDIRVIDAEALRKGVEVLAAAPGKVRAVRDGMPDASVRAIGKAAIADREAGNSVVIEHGGGWETQYAHLRQGSIAVRAGDAVARGQKLGLVGLSGNTEFWHLHFEVRHQRATVDPFVGLEPGEPCQPPKRPLWSEEAQTALQGYVETGVLDAGLAGGAPSLDAGIIDRERAGRFSRTSGAAVFWVVLYGVQAGDREELRVHAPDGTVLSERSNKIGSNRAQWLVYVGKRKGDADWPAGAYRGEYRLYRGPEEREVLALSREVQLQP